MKEHYKTERELVELIGRFYKERDIELIRPYLHTNIIYASSWVKEILRGSNKFLNYMNEKLKNQTASDLKIDFFIHPFRFNKFHFLVLKQNNCSEKTTIIHIEFKHNRIYYMRLCSAKSVPFTFIEPSWYFEKAKQINLNNKMIKHARKLDIKNVLQCIKKGADINAKDEHGETILTTFSKAEKLDAFKILLWKYDYPIEGMNQLLKKKLETIEEKLKAAGYFQERIWGVETWKEHYEKYLLSRQIYDRFARRILKTPIVKRIEMMNKLISLGANINELSLSEMKTARNSLYYAVKNREAELVRFLILNNAEVNIKYKGINETLPEIVLRELREENLTDESYLLIKGKDSQMQIEEIENLKIISEILKQSSHDKSN